MKRFVLFGLIFCLLTFLSACHFFQNFVVVNNSSEEIEVRYELTNSAFQDGKGSVAPQVTTINNLNAWRFLQKNWEQMPAKQFSFNEDAKIFTVKMKPFQVVKIGWEDSYLLEKEGEKHFDIKNLQINGNNKQINFEDSKKLLAKFQKDDYQITYK